MSALYSEILRLTKEKEAKRVHPTHVLLNSDIIQSGWNKSDVLSELKILHREQKIEIGHTINDYYIKVLNHE